MATKVLNIKSWGSEITEIHQFQYRAPQKQEKGVYCFIFIFIFFCGLHKSCLKNQFELIPMAYCRIDISIGL